MFNWLEKLQKLTRLYLSAKECGVDGEADAALHMIQKLQEKYRIKMNIDNIKQVDDIFIRNIILARRSIQPWLMRLGSAISELYSVQFFLCRKTDSDPMSLEFSGLSGNVLSATLVFNTLKSHIMLAIKDFKRSEKRTKKQIRSFALGCSDSIYEYCHLNPIVQIPSEITNFKYFKNRISTNRYNSIDRFSYKQGIQMGKQFVNQQLKQQRKESNK